MSCKSTDEQQMFLFYSSYDNIYRLRPHLTKILSTNGSKILGLDMHFDTTQLYITTEDSDALYVYNWTGKPDASSLSMVKNIGSPTRVALDWITENVYFVDDSKAIKVCHMGARNCITLIEFHDHEHVRSLAIDALHHRLFYTIIKKFEFGIVESTIYAHNLDASQKRAVSKDSFFIPTITCDYYSERVYYVGLETKTIWSVKYDGTGKQLMIARNEFITWPIKINLFESHAYVSNGGSAVVAKCQLYGDKVCTGIQLNVPADNLVIGQKSRQKSGENACANMNCTTICIPTDYNAKCICDFGVMVRPGDQCNNAVSTTYGMSIYVYKYRE